MNKLKKILPASRFIFIFLCLLYFLAIFKVFSAYFVAEDWEWFTRIESLNIYSVQKIFLPQKLGGINTFFYRPMTPFSFWLTMKLFGLNPVPFHLTNFLLHLVSAWLVYKIAIQIIKDKGAAIIAFTFFLLSPFSSQAVSMIDARYDLLATVFLLGGLSVYLNYLKTKRISYLIFTPFLFISALLSKEFTVIFPLIITLVVSSFGLLKKFWKQLAGFYLLSFSYFLLRIFFVSTTIINPLYHEQLFISRLLIIWFVLLVVLGMAKKQLSKLFMFTYFLIGIFYLPTAFLPTEERYLYFPSVALSLFLAQLLKEFLFKIPYFKVKKTLITAGLGSILFVLLFFLNLRWVRAGEIAYSIITQTRSLVSPLYLKIYFFGIPDSEKGALIYRTHLSTALSYNQIKAEIITFPPTVGIGENNITMIDNQNILVNSKRRFLLFKPAITGYSESNQPIIEDNDKKVIFENNNQLRITLKKDNFNNPNSLFLLFSNGLVTPIYAR